jgi:hypothetical protein
VSADEWALVFSARDDVEAHLVAGRLRDAGIEPLLRRSTSGIGDYLLAGANPRAPVDILVSEDDVVRARRELAGLDIHYDVPDPEGEPALSWFRLPTVRWAMAAVAAVIIWSILWSIWSTIS